jgi:alkylhydroperoxidase family enzyme
LARRLGWTEDQINNLQHFEQRTDFTDAEKAALRLAEIETARPHEFTDEMWSELREHFDEGEIVELTAAIGLFNYFNRANDILQMEPTKPGEGAPKT